jgi:hypothetical protein
MFEGADADGQTIDVDLLGLLIQLLVARHLGQTLENVDLAKLGPDEGPVAGAEEGRDRCRVEKAPADLDFPSQFLEKFIERISASTNRSSSSRRRSGVALDCALRCR